ncbi:protein kinase-like domain-containing protein [Artemisia annua]|uniref:non-specific serine/threonine protein kinase n=1 Tax=Artemisia annua TaxID=35608 RepID=A0A2U1LUU0_ARTAN|nr:protein kinase-like domain-containing protein [Artemisia annua]
MAIKQDIKDPRNFLNNWDISSVDPCSWKMITCTNDGSVSALTLQNNALFGPVPSAIGKLQNLQSLDLSGNQFSGELPSSLGDLKNLNLLRLNNNSLTGRVPESLSKVGGLTLVDLSYNNFSGSLPKMSARTFKIVGNPLLCEHNSENGCSLVYPEPLSFPPDGITGKSSSGGKNRRLAIALSTSFGGVLVLILVVVLLIWWRYRKNQQIFFDVNEQYDPEVCLGHLRRFTFKELRAATDHFHVKNILGKGGFGIVYKGSLTDGTVVAVKRLKDDNSFGGEIQFQTEVETISLAVHRNLLRLWGFCSTENERILVYPFMPNGSVASRLKDHIHGKPVLDWPRRKNIALGTARGLLYLHEQSDPKIIHRDVKAANILLDEDFEAVVGDFGLAKLLDHRDSHVTTAVRGTVGHIAPEYLSTGQSSEKTDVFGFGILLLELITGQKALDFGRAANQKGVMLDWVMKLHLDGKLNQIVDKSLKNNYDRIELEEMIQVALLCTQFNPLNRPKMSEVLRMLEGEGLVERWEVSQSIETPRFRALESFPQSEMVVSTSTWIEDKDNGMLSVELKTSDFWSRQILNPNKHRISIPIMSDSIPYDIQEEIIKNLPIKSLVRFRLVSKQWKSLIDSSKFIACYRTQQKHKHHLLGHFYMFSPRVAKTSGLALMYIVSSQGLLFVHRYDALSGTAKGVIWNPTIRKSVDITVRDSYPAYFGFGVCPNTYDPKIVKYKFNSYCRKREFEIFTLSTNAWRRLYKNLPRERIGLGTQVAIDRFMYWSASERIYADDVYQSQMLIVSFDMTSEEFMEISYSASLGVCEEGSLYLDKIRDSLVVVQFKCEPEKPAYSVWKMMEHGVSKSFTKLYTINTTDVISHLYGFRKSGELIAETENNPQMDLFAYDPESEHINYIGIPGTEDFSYVFSYIETLLLLGRRDCSIYFDMDKDMMAY